ncbi:glycosyltransferase family 9 protein [Sediminibacterium roseum]|uniref:Glycosyltransferase family 9 protein n=1 Tax=Sediminibacterium roseum TaxID=1978412 RepID=A0ABW9ZWD9_9BACT|nr:glycosyltransferase family 9 protein [Sediminibacterium roseum]NCI51466.1 glycosyltransferase family 9 protein [Sediminibacterium roseum]
MEEQALQDSTGLSEANAFEDKPVRFLVIRFSSIGDIVLTTPVVRCLKQQVANAEVHFLTKERFSGLVAHNPYIDKIHVLGDSWDMMIHQLKEEQYDYVIDLHHNIRTLRIRKALKKAKHFSFNKLNMRKWLLTALKINTLPDVHIVDRYLDTLRSFGVVNDGKGLDYFYPEKDKIKDTDLPISHIHGYVGVVIGAALNTKKLPVHKLKELCAAVPFPVVLLGGPEDKENGKEIASVDPVKIYNSCGKFSLNESADLVRRANVIVTHDTGLMHIAAALQKPVISVWGNTVPAFGMGPYYGNANIPSEMVEVKNLWCRPCSKIGYDKCPLGHFKCMEKHNMQAIYELVRAHL